MLKTGPILTLSIFPNPFREMLNIQFEASETKGSLSIISLGGEIHMHKNIHAGTGSLQLNLGHLKAGTYVLILRFAGKDYWGRVVKI